MLCTLGGLLVPVPTLTSQAGIKAALLRAETWGAGSG